jgi:hypothetical protein
MLGEVSSLAAVDFNQTLYLAVEIGGTGSPAWDGELLPRKILGAVPAAFYAETAGTALNASSSDTLSGVASSSFLRSDEADTMAATSTSALLTLVQNGVGAIARFFSGVTEVFTILSNGNVGVATSTPSSAFAVAGNTTLDGNITITGTVQAPLLTANRIVYTTTDGFLTDNANLTFDGTNFGIGTSTPGSRLTVVGDAYITGALRDGDNASGTLGMVLQTTGTSTRWVATSTLGFDGTTTFLGLTDTQSSFTANRIMFTNSGATALTDSADFVFDGTNLGIGTSTPSSIFSVSGNSTFVGSATTTGNGYFGGYVGVGTNPNTSYSLSLSNNQMFVKDNMHVYFSNTNTYIGENSNSNKLELRGGGNTGSHTVYIDSVGALGLGDSAPATKLEVVGTSTSGYFAISSNSTVVGDVLRVDGSGNIGIGTSTPSSKLTVAGDAYITGALRDGANASGTLGMVLQTTGTSTRWVATSTLGFDGTTTFLGLTDTQSSFTANRIMFTNSGATALTDSATFVFDGTSLGIGTSTPTSHLSVVGDFYLTGALRDGDNASGTLGMVLQTTGTSTRWVATSTLGFSSGGSTTFLALTDTPSSYTANRILFTSGSAVTDSANLVFTGTNLGVGTSTPNAKLVVSGSADTALLALGNDTDNNQVNFYTGVSSPNNRVIAPIGSLFVDSVAGVLYQKTGDPAGNTAWQTLQISTTTYAARMSRNSTQSIGNNTPVKIAFDTVDFDIGGIADATTNDRFDIKRSGKYLVTASLGLPNIDSGEYLTVRILKNGSEVHESRTLSPAVNTFISTVATDMLDLVAGDYIEMQVQHIEGGALNTDTTAAFRPRMAVTEIAAPTGSGGGSLFTDGSEGTFLTDTASPLLIGTSTNAAGAMFVLRQQSAADILKIFDGNDEVFTIADGGNVSVTGDFLVSAVNGRNWGISGLTTGQTVNFQYGGDQYNEIEATFGQKTLFRSFHGVEFTGGAGNTPIARIGGDSGSTTSYFLGNVGIGTTSPDSNAKLHIEGGDVLYTSLYITHKDNSTYGLVIDNLTSTTSGLGLWVTDTGTAVFDVNDANRMSITSSGNVGIGTTTPNSKLTVEDINTSVDDYRFLFDTYLEFSPVTDETISWDNKITSTRNLIRIPATNSKRVSQAVGGILTAENFGTGEIWRILGSDSWAYNVGNATIGYIVGSGSYSETDSGTVEGIIGNDVWSGVYGGSVTDHIGTQISLSAGGGTITNRYGLLINIDGSAGVTNDYGIYQEAPSQKNYFAGNTGIGTTSPAAALEITTDATSFPDGWGENLKLTGVLPTIWLNESITNKGYLIGQDGGGLFFGNVDSGTVSGYTLVLAANGNVGIGSTTVPAAKLQVFGNIRVGISGTNGCLQRFDGTALTGTCSSDAELKTDILTLASSSRSYIEGIANLNPVTYRWNDVAHEIYKNGTNTKAIGLIAQEVELVFPELVSIDDKGYRQVDFAALPFYVMQAMKEFYQEFLALKDTVTRFAESFSTKLIQANRVDTKKLCLDGVCLTKTQLQDLLNQAAAGSGTSNYTGGYTSPEVISDEEESIEEGDESVVQTEGSEDSPEEEGSWTESEVDNDVVPPPENEVE